MIAVPLILERIHSALRRKILARGRAFAAAFEVAYRYRLFWTRRGCDTPVLNRMLFDRFRAALGGKIEVLVGGGAPLAGEVRGGKKMFSIVMELELIRTKKDIKT